MIVGCCNVFSQQPMYNGLFTDDIKSGLPAERVRDVTAEGEGDDEAERRSEVAPGYEPRPLGCKARSSYHSAQKIKLFFIPFGIHLAVMACREGKVTPVKTPIRALTVMKA